LLTPHDAGIRTVATFIIQQPRPSTLAKRDKTLRSSPRPVLVRNEMGQPRDRRYHVQRRRQLAAQNFAVEDHRRRVPRLVAGLACISGRRRRPGRENLSCYRTISSQPSRYCVLASANASQDSFEWLFEVKTSIGPCETDFIMSQAQHDLVSLSLSSPHRSFLTLNPCSLLVLLCFSVQEASNNQSFPSLPLDAIPQRS
jgi:hypothetical protein